MYVRITPAELFESVSPSRIIFTNLFVGNTEITPGMEGRDILKSNIRLRHGLTLVRQGELTVSEVAYKVGMSPKQFAKFFKEEYGSLPSKYV